MPEVSRFRRIVIAMYRNDHPPPHFRARYGSDHARFEIESGSSIGSLPPGKHRAVLEWLALHRAELRLNWHNLQHDLELIRIAPLE